MSSARIATVLLALCLSAGVVMLPGSPQVTAQEKEDVHALTAAQLELVKIRVNTLALEIEFLLEDLSLRGGSLREAYSRANEVFRDVLRLERDLARDASRPRLYFQYREMDQGLHRLLESLESVEDLSLRRTLARVEYADQQLHFALAHNDRVATVRAELISRQADALVIASRQLARVAAFDLADDPRGRPLLRDINSFVDKSEDFRRTYQKQTDTSRVAVDFSRLDTQWREVVQRLNQSIVSPFVVRKAQHVNVIHNQLHRLLHLDTDIFELPLRLEG